MTKPDKWIIHDTYHVIHNLNIIGEKATKKAIIEYVKIAGKNNNQNYTDEQIKQCLSYLEIIQQIKQIKPDQYEVRDL